MTRCAHSFSTLPVSAAVYAEIEGLLRAAGHHHVFVDGAIDMMGIALVVSDTAVAVDEPHAPRGCLRTGTWESR